MMYEAVCLKKKPAFIYHSKKVIQSPYLNHVFSDYLRQPVKAQIISKALIEVTGVDGPVEMLDGHLVQPAYFLITSVLKDD
jgi:hypothetical protein